MKDLVLEKAGLSPNEVKVYKALLELGSSLAGKLSEKAGIHRRASYDVLNRLIDKGLVGFVIKNNIKYYKAANPERIINYLEEQKQEIDRKKKDVQKIIPELTQAFKTKKSPVDAEIFIGKEGVKTVMENILRQKKEWLTIGSTGKGPKIFPYYAKHHAKSRIKLKIRRKVLSATTQDGIKHAERLKKQGLIQVKFLSKNIKQVSTIWMYGDFVAIILVSTDKPVCFQINNKEIAASFREYFEWLWNIAKK